MRSASGWVLCILLAACAGAPDPRAQRPPSARVLFVGNSLTYYNDLPAKFAALAEDRSPPVETEMLAEAGASLRDRIGDGSLAGALQAQRYDVVVLQDFGGWPLCATTIPACEDGDASLRAAVALARAHGARPLWFGTWLSSRRGMQRPLSIEGQRLANEIGVEFADVGDALEDMPDAGIALREDDGHPADAGSWVAAATLWRAAFPERALPAAPPEACGHERRGISLRGNALASSQPAGARVCSRPPPAAWEAIRALPGR